MREEEESLAQEDLAEIRRLVGGEGRRGMTWGFKGFGRAAAPIFKSGRTAAPGTWTCACRYLVVQVSGERWTGGLVQGCGGADRPGSRSP